MLEVNWDKQIEMQHLQALGNFIGLDTSHVVGDAAAALATRINRHVQINASVVEDNAVWQQQDRQYQELMGFSHCTLYTCMPPLTVKKEAAIYNG